jgi:hypothetical protein
MCGPLRFVALVGVPLAQLPLVAYLARFVELDPDERPPSAGHGYVTYGTAAVRPGEAHDGSAVCPHCERTVDGAYDYCGSCARRLPPARGQGR